MPVQDLDALAQAYQCDDDTDPELLVVGKALPKSPYDHPDGWNAILDLGTYKGQQVHYYCPRSWSYDDSGHAPGYTLHYGEETTSDDAYMEFTLDLPDALTERVIFLNACTNTASLPDGAEILTDNGIVSANGSWALIP